MNSITNPWAPDPARIVRRTRENEDTFTLHLEVPDRTAAFAPGQFNMLYAFGVGEVAISISGDTEEAGSRRHTIRAVGTVTRAIERLPRGATLGIRGPYGSAWPIADAVGKNVLLVAGGVGLAPLRSVVLHVLRHRALFRDFTLLYGARSPSALIFRKDLERWQRRADANIRITVDHAAEDWSGPIGVVPALLDDLAIDAPATIAMVCGPEVMMRFAVRALRRRGLPSESIFVSMERNMKCALRFCGHCQYRESFLCKDGPVVRFDRVATIFDRREI